MDSLPIPENYYYDLGARFGLEDAVLSRMAELNILYDEDERGTYHHLYTRAFAKRFFFEVVQRRITTVMAPGTPPSAWPPNRASGILRPARTFRRCTHPLPGL